MTPSSTEAHTKPVNRDPLDFSEFERPQLSNSLFGFIKGNPLLIMGIGGTSYALITGLKSMVSGDTGKTMAAMRMRIGMQAFGVAALIGGIMLQIHDAEKARKDRRN